MSFKELKPPKNNNNNSNHINNRYENKQKPNTFLDNQIFTNTYNRTLNYLSSKPSSNKKSNHKRNNSMNNVEDLKKTDIISKYFSYRGPKSNYFNYNNCFKFLNIQVRFQIVEIQ